MVFANYVQKFANNFAKLQELTLTVGDGKILKIFGTLTETGTLAIETGGKLHKMVRTSGELTEALEDSRLNNGEIMIKGTIGSESDYGIYNVERSELSIVGIDNGSNKAKVFGSFVVKGTGDDAVFYNLAIQNEGDNAGGANRNAINAYASKLQVEGCDFVSGSKFANGVMILPSATNVVYRIEGNTFTGYDNGIDGWSTTAVLITCSYPMDSKAFFGAGVGVLSAVSTDMDNTKDLAIITGNTFVNCKNDYTRNTLANDTKIYCTANSASDNFRLSSGTDDSKYYVTGDVTRDEDTEVLSGSELIIADGKTLTIAENANVTITGTLTVNGSLVVNGTLIVNGTLNNNGNITCGESAQFNVMGTAQVNNNDGATITVNALDINGEAAAGELTVLASFDTDNKTGALQLKAGSTLTVNGTEYVGSSSLNPTGSGYIILVTRAEQGVYVRTEGTVDVAGNLELEEGGIRTFGSRADSTITVKSGKTLTATAENTTLSFIGTISVEADAALVLDSSTGHCNVMVSGNGTGTISLAEGAKLTKGAYGTISFTDGSTALTADGEITVVAATEDESAEALSAGDYVGQPGVCNFTRTRSE